MVIFSSSGMRTSLDHPSGWPRDGNSQDTIPSTSVGMVTPPLGAGRDLLRQAGDDRGRDLRAVARPAEAPDADVVGRRDQVIGVAGGRLEQRRGLPARG